MGDQSVIELRLYDENITFVLDDNPLQVMPKTRSTTVCKDISIEFHPYMGLIINIALPNGSTQRTVYSGKYYVLYESVRND